MFSSRRRPQAKRASFSDTSPADSSFDFPFAPSPPLVDIPPPPAFSLASEDSIARPRTSHGVAADGKKPAGLSLPPIPRVASRLDSKHSREEMDRENGNWSNMRHDGDSVSTTSSKPALKDQSSSERVGPPSSTAPPATQSRYRAVREREGASTARKGSDSSSSGTPEMTSSLFPARRPSPPSAVAPSAPSTSADEVMDRNFIDSRDRPYQHAPRPFMMQQNHSSPDLTRPDALPSAARQTTPAFTSSGRNWLTPKSSMQNLSSRSTDLSGTTARPSTKASSSYTAHSSSIVVTIGTPYQSTADSFPLPQAVRTRPKTSGATSTVAGISVPTHHTSAVRMPDKPPDPPKKKGRLRNPLSLLQRRKSSHDPELMVDERAARQAQAQALARQRDVVASGINKPPPDFDPRIKGKVVHDFSVPRGKRNTFDESEMPVLADGVQNPDFVPASPTAAYPPRNASLVNRRPRTHAEREQRKSVHTPVFMEHLNDNPDASRRISLINAENLENKDFLYRASKHSSATTHSQESAVLPPFARRSQTLDATQASFFHDDDSKRSSDPSSEKERDSTLGSTTEVSPITARSSGQIADVGPSFSPVSPSSPGNLFRPLSEFGGSPFVPRPGSDASKVSAADDLQRPVSQISVSSLRQVTTSETSAGPHSGITVAPTINTSNLGVNMNPPVDTHLSTPRSPQDRQLVSPLSSASSPALESFPTSSLLLARSTPGSPATQSLTDRTAGMSTPEGTPEPETIQSIQFKPNKDQSNLVERRTSALGHSKKSSGGPKHHASNASRFSFQFASESSAQEQELEEKHRKMQSREIVPSVPRGRSPDGDDEDDFFDEDAMDDMDEMEMQAAHQGQTVGHLTVPTQSSRYLQQARHALHQQDSDEGSVYDENDIPEVTREEDIPYADHPAFRTHSALGNYSRHNSYLQGGSDSYWRGSTIDSYMRDSYYAPTRSRIQSQVSGFNFEFGGSPQDPSIPAEALPKLRSNLSTASSLAVDTSLVRDGRPPIPSRDSGNSERNRAVSGMSFGSTVETTSPGKDSPSRSERDHIVSDTSLSSASNEAKSPHKGAKDVLPVVPAEVGTPDLSPKDERTPRITNPLTPPSTGKATDKKSLTLQTRTPPTLSAGLGLNTFAGFDFSDGPQLALNHSNFILPSAGHSSNTSQDTAGTRWSDFQKLGSGVLGPDPKEPTLGKSRLSEAPHDDPVETAGQSTTRDKMNPSADLRRANLQSASVGDSAFHHNGDDDMYFDDGNFEQDILNSHDDGIDEDVFDDDGFLARPGMAQAVNHRRDNSGKIFSNMGSDGPYPSFAVPNSARESQRLSQMMLEDLPLQAPIDPRYIPQRNPSEDMKRLGLSDRVPPVPVPESNKEAFMKMQADLETYHAALAEAAHKAAVDGRFTRVPSVSTTRSGSSRLNVHPDKNEQTSDDKSVNDDRSVYSHDGEEDGTATLSHNGSDNLAIGAGRRDTAALRLTHLTTYSPPKMSFDFGFDVPSDNEHDFYEGDDDLVAAANAEALASDDEGFYGQEFDFYGRPRANSGELQAVNGGFFGQDGDDGLQRNKSLREPNLTPITERSEFSTRNSFISGQFGPPSAGPWGPQSPALARMPVLPLNEHDVASFDELRRLRLNAFGDNNSARSSSNRSSSHSLQASFSPTVNTRMSYLNGSSQPGQYGYGTDSSGSSNPNIPQVGHSHSFQDSPRSAGSSAGMPFSIDFDATPKKNSSNFEMAEPGTARKVPPLQTGGHLPFQTHSRSGSGADSIGYVQEPDPENNGKPRWVLERRRTSEQGQIELIGREVLHSGWI